MSYGFEAEMELPNPKINSFSIEDTLISDDERNLIVEIGINRLELIECRAKLDEEGLDLVPNSLPYLPEGGTSYFVMRREPGEDGGTLQLKSEKLNPLVIDRTTEMAISSYIQRMFDDRIYPITFDQKVKVIKQFITHNPKSDINDIEYTEMIENFALLITNRIATLTFTQ